MDELGSVAVGYDDTGQSDYPRNVVNLKQTIDAPNGDKMRTFVGLSSDGALLVRRRRNLMTSCEPSFSISSTGERLDVTAHELLTRVRCRISKSWCSPILRSYTRGPERDGPGHGLT